MALMNVKKKSAFTLPGGGIKENETVLNALRRELIEETGCEIEILTEIGIIEENRFKHDFTQLSYYYLGNVIGDKKPPQLTEKEKK